MNTFITFGMEERAERLNNLLLAQKADFSVEYVRVWKNNLELEGYSLKSPVSNVAPTVYYDNSWYSSTDDEVIDFLKDMYQKHAAEFDISMLQDKNYILSHIMPRMVSMANAPELKNRGIAYMPFLDMIVLFYIPVDGIGVDGIATAQITDKLLSSAEITVDEAYAAAIANMESQAEVMSMAELMAQQFGMEFSEEEETIAPMWVCSTKNRVMGAAAVLCASVISALEEKISGKIAILPSSIHECIAIKYNSDEDLRYFTDMVRDINESQVQMHERLTDTVYCVRNHRLQIAC